MHHHLNHDALADYLRNLLYQQKAKLVQEIFYSQHLDWQKRNRELLVQAETLLEKETSASPQYSADPRIS